MKDGASIESTTGKIYTAISAIMAEVGAVGKNETNKQQGYKYRSADDVCDAVRPLLGKHGVIATKEILQHTEQERESKGGSRMLWVKIKCLWTFYATDGSHVATETYGEGMDSGDKATNKAETGAFKNALLQLFCLMGHEDSERESPEVQPQLPTCPGCGKPDHVYEDRQKGRFFCWKQNGGCGHKWLPADEREPPPNIDAKQIAAQHGMKTGDEIAQPSKRCHTALSKIEICVRNKDVEGIAALMNFAEKEREGRRLSQNDYNGIQNECTLALKKINAAEREPAAA